MSASLLLDVSHTSHTRARTGIQRVARSLRDALGDRAEPITWDPYLDAWRRLQDWERANLQAAGPTARRSAAWPWSARLRGRASRLLGRRDRAALPADTAGVIVPELFSRTVADALPRLPANAPRVALFHDAIPLKLPELSPPKTVARFPAYLRELLAFDGIAAVSNDSRDTLIDYWRWLGVPDLPPVVAIPLGIEVPTRPASVAPAATDLPVVLCVGSIEGRKNHLALLEACEQLWARGRRFELHLVGLARAETAAAALARIQALRTAGRPLRHDGAATDDAVDAAYAGCAFSVYPSLLEGFGLPVIESLSHGKPCVCSRRGALGEVAQGGGCVMLESVDATGIATAIERMIADPAEVTRLSREAARRTFRTWRDYAADLTGWMTTLRRRR